MPITRGLKKAKTSKKILKNKDDNQSRRPRRTRSPKNRRNRNLLAPVAARLLSLYAMVKTALFLKDAGKKPARQWRLNKKYQVKDLASKPLSTVLIAPLFLILLLVQVGDCKKQASYNQHQTLEDRIAELIEIKNDMGLREHEACYKWDGIAAKLYLDHQFGRSWADIQKDMLTNDFLIAWKVSSQERNHMALVFFPLMQRADVKERPLGSFTLNETMDIAHALCGERIMTGGLPFQESSYTDDPKAEAHILSSNGI